MSEYLKQLGEAVKQQRLQMTPAHVGLPEAGQRRLSGLSQQEVAVLSAVSVRWLAKLEQGQFRKGDIESLKRVLQTLNFKAAEQDRLLRMAGWEPHNWGEVPQRELKRHLQKLLDGIDYPAYVTDQLWERVCWNKAAGRLFTHWLGKKVRYTNFLDYLLLDPQSRLFVQNWEDYTEFWLRRFVESILPYRDSKAVTAFLDAGCKKSPIFEQLYHECLTTAFHADNSKLSLEYTFHTDKGSRAFTRMAFPVQGASGWQMVVWLPIAKKSAVRAAPAQIETPPPSPPDIEAAQPEDEG